MARACPPSGTYPKDSPDSVIEDYRASLNFLLAFDDSPETFKAYRREVDRFLIWLWHVRKCPLSEITRQDIEAYLAFFKNPPMSWRGIEVKRRFIEQNGLRTPNPEWRPFVVQIPKAIRKSGKTIDLNDWSQSQASYKAAVRILQAFCQFLVDDNFLDKNPVAQLRTKKRKGTTQQRKESVKRLTYTQVRALFEALGRQCKDMSDNHYERLLFILSCLVGMYLRISEIAASEERQPTHGHFKQNIHERDGVVTKSWWFSVLGKGNKERNIPVSDEVMQALARYRVSMGLPPLPTGHETQPLFPKMIGKGGITSTRHVRMMLQGIFDQAYRLLVDQGKVDEAKNLESCTVHWLRHTGISIDVMTRPLAHVSDSAGHSSLAVTGIYIDNDPLESYLTAKTSHILPNVADQARAS